MNNITNIGRGRPRQQNSAAKLRSETHHAVEQKQAKREPATATLTQKRVDAILGKPPGDMTKANKGVWYELACRYPNLKAACRSYLIQYVAAHNELERSIKRLKGAKGIREEVAAESAIRAARKHLLDTSKHIERVIKEQKV